MEADNALTQTSLFDRIPSQQTSLDLPQTAEACRDGHFARIEKIRKRSLGLCWHNKGRQSTTVVNPSVHSERRSLRGDQNKPQAKRVAHALASIQCCFLAAKTSTRKTLNFQQNVNIIQWIIKKKWMNCIWMGDEIVQTTQFKCPGGDNANALERLIPQLFRPHPPVQWFDLLCRLIERMSNGRCCFLMAKKRKFQ